MEGIIVLPIVLEKINNFYENNGNQPAKYILLSNNFYDKLKEELIDINNDFKAFDFIKKDEYFEIIIKGIVCLKISNQKDLLEIV